MQVREVSREVSTMHRVASLVRTRAARSEVGRTMARSNRSAAKVMTKPVTEPYMPSRPLSTSE